MRLACTVIAAALALFLLPDAAAGFGPATHIFLGERLLSALHLLPPLIADLIRAHPQSFLYGSVAADISLGKKYVPAGRHSHFWHVGEEIYSEADGGALRAAGLGYLSHLAADTIAHNYFVPRQLLLTSSTKALGHSYWEHRLDAHLGEQYSAAAREVVIDYDHGAADALFDRVLSATIFSFQTNRRIFRGMIRAQDNERWQTVFEQLLQKSRWDLADDDVEGYVSRAFDSVVDYLNRRRDSIPASRDPTGEFNLQLAKKVRRLALREGAAREPQRLLTLANDFFPLPDDGLPYWLGATRSDGR
ncbi:MAG: zinc dependent phospholipase C family protein [Longimicrobiales bacterium]